MKRVLILGFSKIAYMPYLNFYLEALEGKEYEIHVVSWKREHAADISVKNTNVIVHQFELEQLDEAPKWTKIKSFLKYRRFAQNILHQLMFERIIVLHTLPAILLADVLLIQYRNRFIFDYRDYTYENFTPFKWAVSVIVKASYATFVSSDAFRISLPKVPKIYTSHNILTENLQHRKARVNLPRERRILRLSFWGFIRHEEINKKIIQTLGNDHRFEVHYYGREQQTALNLKAFVAEQQFQNIFFHGAYQPQDRYGFAEQTDLLLNMYENDATMQKAMSNKFYDGLVFYLPQICTKGSYMGWRIAQAKVGIEVVPDIKLGDTVWEYYSTISWNNFEERCDQQLDSILKEYETGIEQIRNF